MSDKPSGWMASVFQRRYREVTPEAIVFGILIGVVMNAAITYSGLKIGFTLGGSAIAAVLGWGVLRGLLRKGSIVENNVAQTVASAVNTSNSGVIFTVPVLFLLGVEFDWLWLGAACSAGAILGVAFIIPTRKQMIDFERLRFPTGTAVAAVLRSPGEGVKKAQVLLFGIGASMLIFFFTKSHELGIPGYEALGIPGVGHETVDVGLWISQVLPWSDSMQFVWAIAPFAIGAGFITGRPGLVVLAGGILAYLIITPIAHASGWMPPEVAGEQAPGWGRSNMNRPLGIGMLMGGALIGLLFALPAMGSAFKGLRPTGGDDSKRSELPLGVLFAAVPLAFGVLFAGAYFTLSEGNVMQAGLIAGIGTAWMWFAGIVIAQCTGMTDWSPISGIALVTVMICLLITGKEVVPAVLVGAAVCVAITLCADMMQDLKTGHMVGGLPIRQQFLELCVVWIGPLVCLAVVWLLARSNMNEFGAAFGPGTDSPAPQAAALQGAIDGIRGGDAPYHLFAMGGLLGAGLSLSGLAGLGVLVGLSMYLPLAYLLPYGLGCLLQMLCQKMKGAAWTETWGVPFAAGMLVGEGLLGVAFAIWSLV
ncbi:MAG: OPT family oligopeptide transporter [Planctomycetota bacterium]